jgi:UDP-N-acetyl-D-mannosaminuronate dehydrogenase
VKLALEVVARTGIGEEANRAAVVQRCVYALRTSDPTLVVAAMRCMIGIGEVAALPLERMRVHIESRSTTVQLAAYVAVALMAEGGVELPVDVIDICAERAMGVRLAAEVVVSACTGVEGARKVLAKVDGAVWEPEFVARVLLKSAKHVELQKKVREIARNVNVAQADPKVTAALARLRDDS